MKMNNKSFTNKLSRRIIVIAAVFVSFFLIGCSKSSPDNFNDYFTQWNSCEALTALQDYVQDVTNSASANYIRPEDRIATFDMDGTFLCELFPTYFECNLLEYRGLEDKTYQAPEDVVEAAQIIRDFVREGVPYPEDWDIRFSLAASKAYAGMTLAEFDAYVKAFAARPANGFTGMSYGQALYKPMLEVINYLKANDFICYVVSGGDRFIVKAIAEGAGIERNYVIGTDVKLVSSGQDTIDGASYTMGMEESIIRTEEFLIKDLNTNKVLQIAQEIGKIPVLSFGNSGGDASMHNYCLSNTLKSAAFMLIADDDERDHSNRQKALELANRWRQAGYHVISMRDDFKTIYGPNVQKVDYTF